MERPGHAGDNRGLKLQDSAVDSPAQRAAKQLTMEPVTKWSPKQVVDWTRGERAVEDPRVLQPGRWGGPRVGHWVLGPSCRRQSKLLPSGLCAHFWCACSDQFLSVGVRVVCSRRDTHI